MRPQLNRYLVPFAFVAVLLVGSAACAAEPVSVPPGAMITVKHPEHGFEIQVPRASVKRVLPADGDVVLSELYIYGDLAYFVRVSRVPQGAVASTLIEQSLQAMTKDLPDPGEARREMESKQKDLFKGVNRPVTAKEFGEAGAAELKKSLWDRGAFESLYVRDEFSPILTVGVIGPASRAEEIETRAQYLAYQTARIEGSVVPDTPAEPSGPPNNLIVTQGSPFKVKPTEKPLAQPSQRKPGEPPAVTSAPNAIPPAERALRKGEIELVGLVESIDSPAKTITLMVDGIRMPNQKPIPLDPVRRKLVAYRRLPAGVEARSRIRVIGKNTGVGKQMTADVIDLVPEADGPAPLIPGSPSQTLRP